jgi:hypothetical protein
VRCTASRDSCLAGAGKKALGGLPPASRYVPQAWRWSLRRSTQRVVPRLRYAANCRDYSISCWRAVSKIDKVSNHSKLLANLVSSCTKAFAWFTRPPTHTRTAADWNVLALAPRADR